MAKTERQKAIQKLDGEFSRFVRMSAADDNGYVFCVTCRAPHHWKDVDCGHFIPRARMATRWDEANCAPQCKRCNYHRHGEPDLFRAALVRAYGKGAVEELERKAALGGSHDAWQMGEMIEAYRARNKALRAEKGFK